VGDIDIKSCTSQSDKDRNTSFFHHRFYYGKDSQARSFAYGDERKHTCFVKFQEETHYYGSFIDAEAFIDGKLPRTVKALKELCTKNKVEAAFQKHFCFRAKKGCKFDLSDSQLRRFRKDVEQRVFAFYAQQALGETPGKLPDSQGHIGGLKTWRLSDFSFDRFEEIEVVEGDDERILQRDYSLKGDTNKKKTSTKKAHKHIDE